MIVGCKPGPANRVSGDLNLVAEDFRHSGKNVERFGRNFRPNAVARQSSNFQGSSHRCKTINLTEDCSSLCGAGALAREFLWEKALPRRYSPKPAKFSVYETTRTG